MFMSVHRCCLCWSLVALGVLLGGSLTYGQRIAENPPADEATPETLQRKLKQLDQVADMDEAIRAKVKETYQSAQAELESAAAWAAKAAQSDQLAAAAPNELEKAKRTLAAMPPQPNTSVPADITLPQIDQAISKAEADLNVDRNKLVELEAKPNARAARRMDLPKYLGRARNRLAEVEKQLQAAPAADELAALAAARRLLLLAGQRNVEREILAYEREIVEYEATSELLPLQRDLAARRVSLVEQRIKQWRDIANRRREREAESQLREARREATQAHSAVRQLAQDNAALAEMREGLAQHIAETTRQLEQARQQLAALKEQFKRVQEKVDAGGLTNAIGLLLRKQREALPNVRFHYHNISARQADIRDSQLALLQLEDRRSELANLDLRVAAVLRNLDRPARQSDRLDLEAAVREMLKTEKEYLDALIGDHNSYFDKLVDLDSAERQLIQETDACGRYIDERVLWIGSAQPLGLADLRHAGDALWWLTRPEAWRELAESLAADARHNPAPLLLALAVFAPLIWFRRRLSGKILAIGEQVARANCCHFRPTLHTVLLTLLAAVVVPGLLWYVSWRLAADLDASPWCKSIGSGLAAMAQVYLVLELIRQVCHPKGLGGAHFQWHAAGLSILRAQVKWLLAAAMPLTFLIAAMDAQDNERWRESLGRLSFVVAALLFSLFLMRALRPAGSVFAAVLASRRGGWLDRLRYGWYPLAVLYPLALSAAAAVGYYYTSQQLAQRLFVTINLLLGLALLRALLLRWALVNRRKLAIGQARQRRAVSQTESNPNSGVVAAATVAAATSSDRDLATINSQTRRLIEYALALAGILGVWFIWVDVMPALRILNQVPLWQTTISVTETVTATDGAAKLQTVERLGAITLADLGLAALMLATTLIAAKNIPGLLEMGLLQHLPLDAGIRYAVATVSRYAITVVGLLLACNTLGLGWPKVQWLLAGISVGLGFGLQEIFAHFVSGLIILFERPVRVGDVITVDDVTGVVSRIHMRATTVTNWDRKELIIPNKEFITGRVLNWTLSDPINRVVIKVGIAYGSDTERATALLLKVADEHPVVLKEPPPAVTFEAFGDSSLNFVLRCFLPNLENRNAVIHQLHMAIDRAFRAAAIEIAYPQQDVHVRSIDIDPAVLQAVVTADGRTPTLHVTDTEEPETVREVA